MKLTLKHMALISIGIAVIAIVLTFLMYRALKSERDSHRMARNASLLLAEQVKIQARKIDTLYTQKGALVIENKAILAATSAELKKYTAEIFDLKKRQEKNIREIQNYTQLIQQYEDSNKLAKWQDEPDTPKLVFVPVLDSGSIKVPKPFLYKDSAFTVAGKVLKNGVMIYNVRLSGTIHLRTFTERTGFLGLKKVTKVQALSENPRIQITGLSTITTTQRPNWWQRWGKPAAAAVIAVSLQNLIK